MVVPGLNHGTTTIIPRYKNGKPWLDHGMTTMVEPCYHGRFCRGTPTLVNLDKSLEVDEWLSKRRSKIKTKSYSQTITLITYYQYAAL